MIDSANEHPTDLRPGTPGAADVADPPPLSLWLRRLWTGSIVAAVAAVVLVAVGTDGSLRAVEGFSSSAPAMVAATIGQTLLLVGLLGVLASAVLTWWERRGTPLPARALRGTPTAATSAPGTADPRPPVPWRVSDDPGA